MTSIPVVAGRARLGDQQLDLADRLPAHRGDRVHRDHRQLLREPGGRGARARPERPAAPGDGLAAQPGAGRARPSSSSTRSGSASADAFRLAMLVGAGLLLVGAAVDYVGLRETARGPASAAPATEGERATIRKRRTGMAPGTRAWASWRREVRIRRAAVIGAGVAAGGAGVARARRSKRHVAYPPAADAIRRERRPARRPRSSSPSRGSRGATSRCHLRARQSTSVDPLLHGRRYFPRMLDDIAAATDSVHLLIYGYKPGEIGTTFRDAAGRQGPGRRRGPPPGRRDRQRDRLRQPGPVQGPARVGDPDRRQRRDPARPRRAAREAPASTGTSTTSATSTTAR